MTGTLRATSLSYAYRSPGARLTRAGVRVPALVGVSISVDRGETVGVVGRSGSGKSTLLRLLLALDRPSAGELHLGDRAVRPGSARALRWFRCRVQYVPQDPASSLEPRMSVEQLVREPLVRLDVPGDHRALVRAVIDEVGLPARLASMRPRELSGGQAQRVAIARSIVTGPDVLLADEPVSGLDLPLRNRVLDLLGALADTRGLGLVFVSHDLDAVARLCARTVVLSSGRVVEEGRTRDLLERPAHTETRALVDALPRLSIPVHAVPAPT